MAEAAKTKEITKQYENREITAGLKVKCVEFKTVKNVADWYMTLPTIQEHKAYIRKLSAVTHLFKWFYMYDNIQYIRSF